MTPLEFPPIFNDELVISIEQSQVRDDVVKLSPYHLPSLTPLNPLFHSVAVVEVQRYDFDGQLQVILSVRGAQLV